MFQQVSQPAFSPQASTIVNRWSLLEGGRNLDLEIHGCGCGCGGCGDCGGCGCGNCGCGCGAECGCGCGSDSGESNTDTDTSTFGECAAAVVTEAAVTGAVTATIGGIAGSAMGVGAAVIAVTGGSAAAAAAAVDEARDNEACNTDNWSKWHEAPYDGGPAA